MGNCCSGGTERTKSGAFHSTSSSTTDILNSTFETDPHSTSTHPLDPTTTPNTPSNTNNNLHPPSNLPDDTIAASEHLAKVMADTQKELQRQRALREEQSRLESIVSTAGRDMVPVARGASVPMGYYDPGYAHASAQALVERGLVHLCDLHYERKEGEEDVDVGVAGFVPRSALSPGDVTSIIDVLSREKWHGIDLERLGGEVLGSSSGVTTSSSSSSSDDRNLEYVLDEICETVLAEIVPTKDKLFQGCFPIVENLP